MITILDRMGQSTNEEELNKFIDKIDSARKKLNLSLNKKTGEIIRKLNYPLTFQ